MKFIQQNIGLLTKKAQVTAFSILGIIGPKGNTKFHFDKEKEALISVEEKILNDVCKLCISQK